VKKIYEVEWLTGRPAVGHEKYLFKSVTSDPLVVNPITKKREAFVVLKRMIGTNHECYNTFASDELADYLESLPAHTVRVRYVVTYDFYRSRGYRIESIGDFGHKPAAQNKISIGGIGGGEIVPPNAKEPCFPWKP